MTLQANGIEKKYLRKTGSANWFYAVEPLDFTLESGKLTMLDGRSGSGKTTLLQMLSGLLSPTAGQVLADGKDLYAMEDKALSRFRNAHLAVIPQGQSGIGSLTVTENILLPATLYGTRADPAEAEALMERLSISHLRDAYPAELSGGEMRRMAIIRAMLQHAEVLFADEPTGDLDDENSRVVLELLREQARAGTAVLLVTHETLAADYADLMLHMNAGKLSR